jgi:hypothetical protein
MLRCILVLGVLAPQLALPANAPAEYQQRCSMCLHRHSSNTSMHAPCPLQLRDFYGPLLATVTATKSAYDAMVRQHSSENTAQGFQAAVRAAPEGEEAKAYRWALGRGPCRAPCRPTVLLACSLLLLALVHHQFISRRAGGCCAQPHRALQACSLRCWWLACAAGVAAPGSHAAPYAIQCSAGKLPGAGAVDDPSRQAAGRRCQHLQGCRWHCLTWHMLASQPLLLTNALPRPAPGSG